MLERLCPSRLAASSTPSDSATQEAQEARRRVGRDRPERQGRANCGADSSVSQA